MTWVFEVAPKLVVQLTLACVQEERLRRASSRRGLVQKASVGKESWRRWSSTLLNSNTKCWSLDKQEDMDWRASWWSEMRLPIGRCMVSRCNYVCIMPTFIWIITSFHLETSINTHNQSSHIFSLISWVIINLVDFLDLGEYVQSQIWKQFVCLSSRHS